jgi:hypothetical protein
MRRLGKREVFEIAEFADQEQTATMLWSAEVCSVEDTVSCSVTSESCTSTSFAKVRLPAVTLHRAYVLHQEHERPDLDDDADKLQDQIVPFVGRRTAALPREPLTGRPSGDKRTFSNPCI